MGVLNKAFFKIGYLTASNPGTSCCFGIMLTLITALGFINFKLTVISPYTYNIYFRIILKTCGFLNYQEPTLSKPILTVNSGLSSELTLSGSPHLMTAKQTKTYLTLLTLSCYTLCR